MSFKDFLDKKNCFKLICGAGNENYEEIKRHCYLYAKSGCKFFDINASIEALNSAKEGCKLAGVNDAFFCISVGINDDPHFQKAKINNKYCKNCGICKKVCLQNAILYNNTGNSIDKKKCIGCKKCFNICSQNAIEMYSINKSYLDIIPKLINIGIDCIEIHTVSNNYEAVKQTIDEVTSIYSGPISICLDRTKFGDEQSIQQLRYAKSKIRDIFIVQADGAPMSGGKDDYRTTLQAIAMADIVLKSNITEYIFLSGGTNSKTKKLAKMFDLDITGIGIGSFARKIANRNLSDEILINDIQKLINSCL